MTFSEFHSTPDVANSIDQPTPTGFSFDNAHRNAMLLKKSAANDNNNNNNNMMMMMSMMGNGSHKAATSEQPTMIMEKIKKTGTTIVGIVYKDGVVLGSDTRATVGNTVELKNILKLHNLAPNIYCGGSGTAADCEKTTDIIRSKLDLLRLDTHTTTSRVVTAVTFLKRMLFNYQGHLGVGLIVGGVDIDGPHIYNCTRHGFTCRVPFTAEGSGTLAAMACLEHGWTPNLTEDEAVALVSRAIQAGIYNDIGSGSNVDVCIIKKAPGSESNPTIPPLVDFRRTAVPGPDVKPLKQAIKRVVERMDIPIGTTPVISTSYKPHPNIPTLEDVEVTDMEVE